MITQGSEDHDTHRRRGVNTGNNRSKHYNYEIITESKETEAEIRLKVWELQLEIPLEDCIASRVIKQSSNSGLPFLRCKTGDINRSYFRMIRKTNKSTHIKCFSVVYLILTTGYFQYMLICIS